MVAISCIRDIRGYGRLVPVVGAALFLAIAVMVYWPSMRGPFLFDDTPNIVENPYLRLENISFKGIYDASFKGPSSTRPVSKISFALNYWLHGLNPTGYRWTNVVIHAVNALLVALFFKQTFGLIRKNQISIGILYIAEQSEPILDRSLPWLIAGLWLINPLQTQSVSYIVQRMNSLAVLFYLMTFLFYLKARRSGHAKPRYTAWTGCVLSMVLAMGSKEIAITLPVLLFLYEWFFFRDLDRVWLKKQMGLIIGVFFLVAVIGIVYTRGHPFEAILDSYSKRDFTLTERLLTQPRVVFLYFGQFLFPHPTLLNLDHDFSISKSLLEPASTLAAVLGIGALMAASVLFVRKARLLSFGILWILGSLVLESSFIGLEMVFEHRMYLPSIMAAALVVLWLRRILRNSFAFLILIAAFGIVNGIWTHDRNQVWSDAVLLWSDSVDKSGQKARPYFNLGAAFLDRGESELARDYFLKSIKIDARYAKAHYNLGVLAQDEGRLDEALVRYDTAIRSEKRYAQAYNNAAMILSQMGKMAEAEAYYRQAIELRPSLEEAHINFSLFLVESGRKEKAIEHLGAALKKIPTSIQLNTQLGHLLMATGNIRSAVPYFARAVQLDPRSASALNHLGVALIQIGQKEKAIQLFREALVLDPTHKNAGNNLALAEKSQ